MATSGQIATGRGPHAVRDPPVTRFTISRVSVPMLLQDWSLELGSAAKATETVDFA